MEVVIPKRPHKPKNYEKSFASHHRAINWSSDNYYKPEDYCISSDEKCWFYCEKCTHTFDAKLSSISAGKWCPYCVIPSRILCNDDDCKICFERSFTSHPKSKFWSDKNDLTARQCLKASNKKYLFNCDCSHEFKATLNDIINGMFCAYCANKKLCDNAECKICFDKSFASSQKTRCWSDKNDLTARECFKSSNKKCCFNCNNCGHEFKALLNNISAGKWCPYCSGRCICDNIECNTCFKGSFASHPKSEFWSDKNEKNPRECSISSGKKFWFKCENAHDFDSTLANITNLNNWCPKCKNKTERKLYEYLVILYPNIKTQVKFDWCKNVNNNCLPFDFVIEDLNIIIELDGEQHFKDMNHWNSIAAEQQKNDVFKMLCALVNGYRIIRIYQPTVLSDLTDWQSVLLESINENINIYYLAQNVKLYDPLINLMNKLEL